MNTASSQILERVKKLLALANSDVPAERDLALAKANSLIAEHKIDMVLLNAVDTSKPEDFVEEVAEQGRRLPVEAKFIAWLLRKHFRCTVVFGREYPNRTFKVIGRKSDAEFGRWMVGYLLREFRARWAYFKKSTGTPQREYNTFLYGMYQGLDARLKEEAKALEDRKFSEAAAVTTCDIGAAPAPTADQLRNRYSVVVRSEADLLQAELNRRYSRLRSTTFRVSANTSSGTHSAGLGQGRSISTNRPLAG
jgi:hypothetical protein